MPDVLLEVITMAKLLYGQRVKVGGREGIVIDDSDKVKVKFDNGEVGFFPMDGIEPVVEDTRLKEIKTCQNCGHKIDSMLIENCPHCGAHIQTVTSRGKAADHFMQHPTAAGQDPLAQPERKTGRSVGEEQEVMGKSLDRFAPHK
jgi:predicted RNA-binding Zn-ribbon protein involved in translation (DUF1610 family)